MKTRPVAGGGRPTSCFPVGGGKPSKPGKPNKPQHWTPIGNIDDFKPHKPKPVNISPR